MKKQTKTIEYGEKTRDTHDLLTVRIQSGTVPFISGLRPTKPESADDDVH